MENLIYKGQFITIYLNEEQAFPILKSVWEEDSKTMEDEEFISEIEAWCKLVEEHKPKACIVNTLKFGFTITVELQDWYNKEITPRKFEAGLRRMAFIIPKELLSELSIEQIFDEQTEVAFKYVENEELALEWILS